MSHLTHLSVDLSTVQPHDESSIQNLTHLSIHASKANSSWREWEFLARLPKLTHISADHAIEDHISKVLLLYPFLKLLVVESFVSYINLGACYLVDDDCLVLMTAQNYTDHVVDWERGANGGVDLWIFSERIMFARSSECLFWFLIHLV